MRQTPRFGKTGSYQIPASDTIFRTRPSGLWKRDTWKRVGPQKYKGYGIAECDGEDLAELARLVTGHFSDYNGKWNGTVKKGDKIPVHSLLALVDERMRDNVVAATAGFKGTFPFPGQKFEDGRKKMSETAISDDFFGLSGAGVVDCLGAVRLVMAKGLIDTLQPGEFDKLFGSPAAVPMAASFDGKMLIGDWGYIKNDPRYLFFHPRMPMQGENVIKVSATQYWGFVGIGVIKTFEEWSDDLLAAYNDGLEARNQAKQLKGKEPSNIQFLAVEKISMSAFDLRRSLPTPLKP